MKNINQLAVMRGNLPAQQDTQQQPRVLNEFARQNINNVFIRLQAIFPAWRTAYPTDADLAEAKKIWVMGFIDAGISSTEQIAAGMRKARLSGVDFFPSVGKFIGWCKPSPEDIGLPPASIAYQEAGMHADRPSRHNWSHPAIYEAGRRARWYGLRNGTVTERMFNATYAAVCAEALAGVVFAQPEPDATRLEHHTAGKQVVTEEAKAAAKSTVADLLKGLRV